jgi:hypothetical protein
MADQLMIPLVIMIIAYVERLVRTAMALHTLLSITADLISASSRPVSCFRRSTKGEVWSPSFLFAVLWFPEEYP